MISSPLSFFAVFSKSLEVLSRPLLFIAMFSVFCRPLRCLVGPTYGTVFKFFCVFILLNRYKDFNIFTSVFSLFKVSFLYQREFI